MAAAVTASRKAIELFPHNALFISDHGYNLLALGRVRDAIDVMQGCRDLVSDAPHLSYWLAQAYLRLGETKSARTEALNAYLLLPNHPEIFELAWMIEDHCDACRKQSAAMSGGPWTDSDFDTGQGVHT